MGLHRRSVSGSLCSSLPFCWSAGPSARCVLSVRPTEAVMLTPTDLAHAMGYVGFVVVVLRLLSWALD